MLFNMAFPVILTEKMTNYKQTKNIFLVKLFTEQMSLITEVSLK